MLVKIKTFPDSKKAKVLKKSKDKYEVHVKENAERGKANEAVLLKMGEEFNVAPSKIRIIKGKRSPSKILEIPTG